jgi:hypothetical protein
MECPEFLSRNPILLSWTSTPAEETHKEKDVDTIHAVELRLLRREKWALVWTVESGKDG